MYRTEFVRDSSGFTAASVRATALRIGMSKGVAGGTENKGRSGTTWGQGMYLASYRSSLLEYRAQDMPGKVV